MHVPVELVRQGCALTLLAARNSQAFVLVVADRIARNPVTGDARVIGRIWAAQLNLAEVVIDEPVGLADEAYQHWHKMVDLHREFVHRLFEACDTRDLLAAPGGADSNVIPMLSRLGPA